MNELPSSKRNHWRGRALRITVFAAIAAATSAITWLTCRPALTWWTSPPIGKTGRHLRMLVPEGWELESPIDSGQYEIDPDQKGNVVWSAHYRFLPVDRRPGFLRRLFPHTEEDAKVNVDVGQSRKQVALWAGIGATISREDSPPYPHCASRFISFNDTRIIAEADYFRSNLPAFDATYKQICMSMRIE
jgi:hypothetical protein